MKTSTLSNFCSKLIILVLLFLSFNETLFAAGGLRGRVFDKTTNEPLIGANVIVQGTSLGSATDLEGRYSIVGIPAGKHTIVVSYIGYRQESTEIEILDNRTVQQDFYLEFITLEGETIVITAQVEGQVQAINQQFSSNTIANVVSKSRIKELPDVNAAESIGRLPGVSIQRYGGEATKVEIRGLSPKYNAVTVNGVRLPATGGNDRSVDLSLISSNILDGIEVKKANLPDMDADALGGTVDLKLREAPEGFHLNTNIQGGYNKLQNYYGNYNLSANLSNRFLNNKLGVIASFNTDNYDRSADKFQGEYLRTTDVTTGETQVYISQLRLREENVKRQRTGGSLLLDYKLSNGKITANSFYNKLTWDGLYRINRMLLSENRHFYDLEDRGGTTSIFTGAVGMEQDFNWIKYDFSVSHTSSRNDNPSDRTWTFVQENASFETGKITPDTHPTEVPSFVTLDTNATGLESAYIYGTKLNEDETAFQLNLQMPFTLSKDINGYIKAGTKFKWLKRLYDQEQNGRGSLQYGAGTGLSRELRRILLYLAQKYPEQFNFQSDSILVRENAVLPISRFLSDYNRDDFLNGDYPLGFVVDNDLMNKVMEAIFAKDKIEGDTAAIARRYSIGSLGNDYDGKESIQAAYFMGELNLTKYLTLIGGMRWEKEHTVYNGQRFRQVTPNNVEAAPADFEGLEIERDNEFFLPMIHLIVKPVDWMKIRLARTETLTRPDFIQYAPITWVNSYQSYIKAANSKIKPSHSTNYDLSVSVYENYVGLFSVTGFYKKIDDLAFYASYILQPGLAYTFEDTAFVSGLNIPNSWLKSAPQIDTYINNPEPAYYKGVELEWQTNFWYLPSILKGVVLNVNYTYIHSEIKKQLFYNKLGDLIPGTRPPRRQPILVDSFRVARMPDQPKHIVNVTLGYDYKGFSARLSYLYQTDKVTYISSESALDNFTGPYSRWDFTVQQKLDNGIQVFANFTNLNNRPDESFRGSSLRNPTYIEYYGFSMDVGIRYNL
ncbi:MAG: TonB-dependent receptor [Melioribacter sp.]|uniref:TonB-dependent receptor n=1 Tax=Melioribacter sp. TaxID=2052167 RepID=UPI003BC5A5AF